MREIQTSLLSVGIVVPTMDNTFFSRLADCAERFLYSKGCMALIMSSDNHAGKEKNQLRTLAAMGVRGILCVTGNPVRNASFPVYPTTTGLRWP